MTPTTKGELTTEQQAALAECERIVDAGIVSFVEVGKALLQISDERLYRVTHGSFADYVNDRYKMSARRAYQLCAAAEVVKEVSESVQTISQSLNSNQAVALSQAPAGTRAAVLEAVTATGKPTAQRIRAAIKPKPEPKPVTEGDKWTEATKGLSLAHEKSPLDIYLESLSAVVQNALRSLSPTDLELFAAELAIQSKTLTLKLEEMQKL